MGIFRRTHDTKSHSTTQQVDEKKKYPHFAATELAARLCGEPSLATALRFMTNRQSTLMEVTGALSSCAKREHFEFGEDTALVAVQHMLMQTVDLFRAAETIGLKLENIFALGKVYSNSFPVITTLKDMGVTVTESTVPMPGEFDVCFERDIKHLWDVVSEGLAQRRVRRIVVLDDGGACITNMPPALLWQYPVSGVEQTSLGMFVLEQRPPPFAVISWARAALKLYIGGPMFSHCLIDRLNSRFLGGRSLNGAEVGIIGLGSIGKALANLALRQGSSVMFYDPDPDLPIPQYLKVSLTRLDSLEELMLHCDYVLGCSGRNPFQDRWPMAHRPGIKLLSASGGDQEFGPIIQDLKSGTTFKVAADTWDISSDDGPSGPIYIAYQGYPYNFVSRGTAAVPTRIVQLETGGLLAGLIQARSYLAAREGGHEQNARIHRMSPNAQRFVYERWLRAMEDRNIDVKEIYGYDPALLEAARDRNWFVDNTEPKERERPGPISLAERVFSSAVDRGINLISEARVAGA